MCHKYINFISNLRDNLEVFLLNYTRYLDGVKCIKKSVHKYDYEALDNKLEKKI